MERKLGKHGAKKNNWHRLAGVGQVGGAQDIIYIYAKISCSSYFLSGTRVFVNVVSLFREVFLPGTDLVLRIRCLVRTDFCSYDLPKLIVNS